jgi:hypothetical protein
MRPPVERLTRSTVDLNGFHASEGMLLIRSENTSTTVRTMSSPPSKAVHRGSDERCTVIRL